MRSLKDLVGIKKVLLFQAVSGKDEPHNNFFFYDGVSTTGLVHNVSPATETEEEKFPIKSMKKLFFNIRGKVPA